MIENEHLEACLCQKTSEKISRVGLPSVTPKKTKEWVQVKETKNKILVRVKKSKNSE